MLADHYEPFSTTPVTFRKFRHLPAELRIEIWRAALPGARTIHLVNNLTNVSPVGSDSSEEERWSPICSTPKMFDFNSDKIYRPSIKSPRRSNGVLSHCVGTVPCPIEILSLLQACRESRFETLARYQPLYVPRSPTDPYFHPQWFDPETDGVFVDEIWPWARGGGCKPTGLFQTKVLSISCNAWYFKWAMKSPQLLGKSGLLRFKDLEELHIVFRVLTDEERQKIMQYKFGQYMGPGDMTQFLRRPHKPHDIAFPSISVGIEVDAVLRCFEEIHTANPTWKIPKVKLMAWATSPNQFAGSPSIW